MRRARPRAAAAIAGWWPIDGAAGYALVRELLDLGFDPAFTLDAGLGTAFTIPLEFCGYPRETPFLPVFVNAYVPPQPSPERCFAFGQALALALERIGRRAVVLASGGLSHYPGTPQYPHPDLATDKVIFERLKAGNLRYLLSLDAAALDRSGNVECRSLQILAGMIGDRPPQSALFEPSWHHIYAVLGWTDLAPRPESGRTTRRPRPSARRWPARSSGWSATRRRAPPSATTPAAMPPASVSPEDERAALLALDRETLRDRFAINPMLLYQLENRLG